MRSGIGPTHGHSGQHLYGPLPTELVSMRTYEVQMRLLQVSDRAFRRSGPGELGTRGWLAEWPFI